MTRNVLTDGEPFSVAMLNSMINAHAAEGVIDGFEIGTGAGDFEVDVGSGVIRLGEDFASVGSETVDHGGSSDEDRIDLITADLDGTLSVVTGQEAATPGEPVAPPVPEGDVLIGAVHVRGESGGISTTDIFGEYRSRLGRPPIEIVDEAVTFDEGDVSVTHTDTEVSDSTIRLSDFTDDAPQLPDDTTTTSAATSEHGLVFNPNTDLDWITARVSSNTEDEGSDLDIVVQYDNIDTVVFSQTVSSLSPGDVLYIEFDFTISAGTDFRLTIDPHDTYTRGTAGESATDYPYESSALDVVSGYPPAAEDLRPCFDIISAGVFSGSTTIEWDHPDVIGSWDLAAYRGGADGETLDLTVEREDPSQGWVAAIEDISTHELIGAIDETENVRLVADFEREDLSNNPSVEYAARRFVR